MSGSVKAQLKRFFSVYGGRIASVLLLAGLYYTVYYVCGHPAGNLFLPEWGAEHLLLPALCISLISAALNRLFLAYSALVGYCAGVLGGMLMNRDFGTLASDGPRHAVLLFAAILLLGLLLEAIVFRLQRRRK